MNKKADFWESMWEIQSTQQASLGLDPSRMDSVEKAISSKDLVLGLMEEVVELSGAANRFKAHIFKAHPPTRPAILEETVDVLKYLLALAQLHGLESEEIYEEFIKKSVVVGDRALGERFTIEKDVRVALVDMDGCLADLSELKLELEQIRCDEFRRDEYIRKLAKQEELKRTHRATGRFENLPPIPGAIDGVGKIKALGYKIVIVTARPYRQHKRLYGDTLRWLQKHQVEYDLLLFQRDKAEAITEHVYPAKPCFFVEDRLKHALEVAVFGVPVFLLAGSDVRFGDDIPLITVVKDWQELLENVLEID